MTDRQPQSGEPAEARAPLSTRAAPPRPRRLSRKALATLTGVSALGIAAALAYSLGDNGSTQGRRETVSVERRQSDLLSSAPRDYSELPRDAAGGLGPPPANLPIKPATGDLPGPAPSPAPSKADSAEERRRQQAESARASKLFASAGERGAPAPGAETPGAAPTTQPPHTQPPSSGDAEGRGAAVLFGGAAEPTTNSGRLTAPAGRHVVTAGSTIAAALITGLSSDLPGQVVAQVTEDVFDSATGQTRLIPQGTRLLGSYDSKVSTGQSRALVVWTRLILPDGRSLDLDRMIGTDATGQSGAADRVDNHWGTILKAGLLATLLGVGTQAGGSGDDDAIADAIRDSAGQTVGRAGDRVVERQLGVQPTIKVRPGARVRVLVGRDLILAPWPDAAAED